MERKSLKSSPFLRNKFLIYLACLSFAWNCAVFNRNNTPLVVQVEDHLIPEETGPKILAAPIYIPLGLVAGVLDLFIVHPIIRIPDAYRDTISALWTPHPENGYVTRMAFLPIVIVLTPIFFTGDLLIRSSFDVNGNSDRSRIEENPIPKLSIYEALEANDREAILAWLKIPAHNWSPELIQKIVEKYPNDAWIQRAALKRLIGISNGKNYSKYESYLATFIGKEPEVLDYDLTRFFIDYRSEVGAQAMCELLASKKIGKKSEELYVSTILEIGKPKQTRALVELYLNHPEMKKRILTRLAWILRYKGDTESYDGYFIDILNRDYDLDETILPDFVRKKSAKGSEALKNILLSGKLSKSSLRLYVKTILEIGIEKDMQAILEKFPSSGK